MNQELRDRISDGFEFRKSSFSEMNDNEYFVLIDFDFYGHSLSAMMDNVPENAGQVILMGDVNFLSYEAAKDLRNYIGNYARKHQLI